MPPLEFAQLLDRSLALMAREAPRAYERLGDAFGASAVRLEVGEERIAVRFAEKRHRLEASARGQSALVRVDRATILALADGELALLDAILCERLWLQGSVDAVIHFDAALLAYLDGALRCPSFPKLLREYHGARA